MSHQDRVTVCPGFFTDPGPSCGDEKKEGTGCICMAKARHGCCGESYTAAPCCKNIASFFRLGILTVRIEKLSLPTPDAGPAAEQEKNKPCAGNDLRFVPTGFLTIHPPPLSGRRLVNFLHQIKIPALPDLA